MVPAFERKAPWILSFVDFGQGMLCLLSACPCDWRRSLSAVLRRSVVKSGGNASWPMRAFNHYSSLYLQRSHASFMAIISDNELDRIINCELK